MAEISAGPAGCGYAAQSLFLRGLCCQPDPRLLRHRGSAAPALATTMMSRLACPCTAGGLAVAVVIGRCPCSCWCGERADPGRGTDRRASARRSTTAPGCRRWHRASRGSVAAVRDDGHEKLPKDGQIAARWRPWELPGGGQEICPTRS